MPNFILNITSLDDDLMLNSNDFDCYILNSEMAQSALKQRVEQLSALGKIVLLSGMNAASLCAPLKADGIVADLSKSDNIKKDMADLRAQIGNGVLGTVSRCRRHEAMLISENEPDFIIFKQWKDGSEKIKDLTEWYGEFFLLQMAIWPQEDEIDLSDYPADIVIFSPESYKIFVAKK